MVIKDRIYGNTDVTSACMVELIESPPLQRLKGIAQFGIPDEYYHAKNYSRYEHSVGVMLLLKKLGASEEEQIAGLLHDVSHTAFSHVIDWVVGDGRTEDYQDEQHARYVRQSVIPDILGKHGYKTERMVDYHHFGLLERDTPDLCADRVDYSLREMPDEIAKACVRALTASNGRIVFKDKESAALFAGQFALLQAGHWGGFEAVSRYRIFANALRHAIKEGTITEEDFWKDDEFVINKLRTSANKKLQQALRVLQNKSLAHLDTGATVAHKKFRYVDPLYITKGKLVRLSQDQQFAKEIAAARERNSLGIALPLLAEI